MSQKQKIRQTRGWLEQNADFREWILKVVEETQKPSWKPSPAPFLPSAPEKRGGGQRCWVLCVLTPDFSNGRKSSGRREVSQSRSWLYGLCKRKNNNKKNSSHSYLCSQHVLRSRPGPQATETMGSGRGKRRVTPFFTCPCSTSAPDNPPPSRRLAWLREHPFFLGVVV